MNDARTISNLSKPRSAKSELLGRIRRIHLEESLVEFACDLCLEEVPVETAFQRIQDRALERMVPLLDTKILTDPDAMRSCLEMVAAESERVALRALQRGSQMLEEGLAILEESAIELPNSEYLN